jgi:hypothetical protein
LGRERSGPEEHIWLLFYLGVVNVLNLHIIDLARKYYTHLQREIEKEEAREKEWKNSH